MKLPAGDLTMPLSAIHIGSGDFVRIEFEKTIQSVKPAEASTGNQDIYASPGFIDLQVNGFAGVDFNDPTTKMDELARAIDAILATGVTRFLPTVITGPPDHMLACLRNLRLAQEEL